MLKGTVDVRNFNRFLREASSQLNTKTMRKLATKAMYSITQKTLATATREQGLQKLRRKIDTYYRNKREDGFFNLEGKTYPTRFFSEAVANKRNIKKSSKYRRIIRKLNTAFERSKKKAYRAIGFTHKTWMWLTERSAKRIGEFTKAPSWVKKARPQKSVKKSSLIRYRTITKFGQVAVWIQNKALGVRDSRASPNGAQIFSKSTGLAVNEIMPKQQKWFKTITAKFKRLKGFK